jgi:hypothetical protein
MVNKLNFLIPENFIDDMHIFIKAKVMNEMETTQTSLTSSNSLNDIKESEIIEVSKEKITHQNEKKIAMVFEKDEKQRIDEATKKHINFISLRKTNERVATFTIHIFSIFS